jgi:hypothetical protein
MNWEYGSGPHEGTTSFYPEEWLPGNIPQPQNNGGLGPTIAEINEFYAEEGRRRAEWREIQKREAAWRAGEPERQKAAAEKAKRNAELAQKKAEENALRRAELARKKAQEEKEKKEFIDLVDKYIEELNALHDKKEFSALRLKLDEMAELEKTPIGMRLGFKVSNQHYINYTGMPKHTGPVRTIKSKARKHKSTRRRRRNF